MTCALLVCRELLLHLCFFFFFPFSSELGLCVETRNCNRESSLPNKLEMAATFLLALSPEPPPDLEVGISDRALPCVALVMSQDEVKKAV